MINETKAKDLFLKLTCETRRRFESLMRPRVFCTAEALGKGDNAVTDSELAFYIMISCTNFELGTANERAIAKKISECAFLNMEGGVRHKPVFAIGAKSSLIKKKLVSSLPAERLLGVTSRVGELVVAFADKKEAPSRLFTVSVPLFHNAMLRFNVELAIEDQIVSFDLVDFFGCLDVQLPNDLDRDWDSIANLIAELSMAFLS